MSKYIIGQKVYLIENSRYELYGDIIDMYVDNRGKMIVKMVDTSGYTSTYYAHLLFKRWDTGAYFAIVQEPNDLLKEML